MNYRSLISEEVYWKDRIFMQGSSQTDLAQAVVYSALRYDHSPTYTPEELDARSLLDRLCDEIGTTVEDVEYSGFKWSMRLATAATYEDPAVGVSMDVIENIAAHLLEDKTIRGHFDKVRKTIERREPRKLTSLVAGSLVTVGLTVAETTNLIPSLSSGWFEAFVSNALTGALVTTLGLVIDAVRIKRPWWNALYDLELAAKPKIYREWLGVAQTQGYAETLVGWSHPPTTATTTILTSQTRLRMRDLISGKIDKSSVEEGEYPGFTLLAFPKNPQLRGNCLVAFALPPENRRRQWGSKPKAMGNELW